MRDKSSKYGFICLIVVIALCIAFVLIPLYKNAQSIGESAGEASGKAVGTAVGSYKGATEEFPAGFDDGKKEGLSGKDTKVEMQNSLTEVENLEVLVSSFKINNFHEVADKYAALYLLKAEAVFSVDLSKASVEVSEDGNTIFITLPQPDVDIYVDDSQTDKAWSYQKSWFSGSAEDGFDAYIGSMDNLESNAKETAQNDDGLMQSARDSAERQIQQIANSVCVNGEDVKILWEDN